LIEVAFVTCANVPEMTPDDGMVAEVVRGRGGCVVIRSAWDYHLRERQYAEWLRQRIADGSRVWNPPHAVLANLDKAYLRGFAEAGLDVVPMEYVERGETRRLGVILESRGWNDVVVKPAVSASAYGTWRASLATADADQPRFQQEAETYALLVQPFVEEVASHGEWSLVFFGGEYSHAVLKRPAAGDFRVQEELGGAAVAATPPSAMVEQARAILAHAGGPLLYARVDGVERAGRLVLMELEINEPFLFIGSSSGAAERFAEAVIRSARLTPH
jgi:glutathione synthase/RimK-type ligase-like ATP-grasp enzyme